MSWQVEICMDIGELEIDVKIEGGVAPVALVGPNGSGKTTLLRTFAGAYRPRSGRISIDDRQIFDSKSGIDLAPEKRRVGYVPQGYGLFPHLNVLDNVSFGWRGESRRANRHRAAAELLERMGFGYLISRTSSVLSVGEQQRVAIARALMIDPQILLLDEPLAALDVPARRTLRSYLSKYLVEHDLPALIVTHDVRDVRALKATVYVIETGRIVQSGSVEDLAAHPASEFVAEFFDSDVVVAGVVASEDSL